MLIFPSLKILSHITHFGHHVIWVISSEKDSQPKQLYFGDIEAYAIPRCHYFPGNSIVARGFNKPFHIFKKIRFVIKIFQEGKYNLIFARDDPFDGLIAIYIKRKYKVPFIFELPNSLEQEWEILKIRRMKPELLYYLIAKSKKFLRTYLLHHADLVLPISKWLKDDLIKHKRVPESKIMVFPEGADVEVLPTREREKIVEKYQLNNLKVIIYQGTLDKARSLKILLRGFLKVVKEREAVKLLIIGEGDDKEDLQNLVEDLGIKDEVIFTGRVPQSEVLDFIAAADVGVSPVPPLSFYKFSSPIKLFEYMAAGKPVVANEEIPEHKEVLEESGGGILTPFTPEAFADAISDLLDNPEKAAEMGRRGREWVAKNRSYEVLARQVEERYLSLI